MNSSRYQYIIRASLDEHPEVERLVAASEAADTYERLLARFPAICAALIVIKHGNEKILMSTRNYN